MKTKKFELVADMSVSFAGKTLSRIRALTEFKTSKGDIVKVGDLGGYVESEENLSQNGNAWIYDDAFVIGNARVYDDAEVHGNALVCGNAGVFDDAEVCGRACVYGNAEVYGSARVYGRACVHGDCRISEKARICRDNQVLTIGPIGSRDATITFYRNKNDEITVVCGCFLGTIDDFLKKVKKTHGDSKHGDVYRLAAELAKIQIDLTEEV